MGLGDLCRQYLMNGFRHIRIVWILQIFSRVLRQPAPGRYSKVPCADHSDEPLNAGNATHFPEFHLHCTKVSCHIRRVPAVIYAVNLNLA